MAPCSNCGSRHKITIYKSINTAQNPELKDKLKDGSLFIWECPHCGSKNLAKYETLYHDPDKKIMIWLMPDGDLSETQMQAISNHAKAIGNYTLRRVCDTGSLMEKLLIFDAGLDDAVIEMCKFVTKLELGGKNRNEEYIRKLSATPLHFFRTEGEDSEKAIILMYPENNQMNALKIGMNVYEDCQGILYRNPDIKPSDSFSKIDQDWISSVMK